MEVQLARAGGGGGGEYDPPGAGGAAGMVVVEEVVEQVQIGAGGSGISWFTINTGSGGGGVGRSRWFRVELVVEQV